jgi:hypothetical protein
MRTQTRSIEFMAGLSLPKMRLGRADELAVKAYYGEVRVVKRFATITYRSERAPLESRAESKMAARANLYDLLKAQPAEGLVTISKVLAGFSRIVARLRTKI